MKILVRLNIASFLTVGMSHVDTIRAKSIEPGPLTSGRFATLNLFVMRAQSQGASAGIDRLCKNAKSVVEEILTRRAGYLYFAKGMMSCRESLV
jgi:hypothetical protein